MSHVIPTMHSRPWSCKTLFANSSPRMHESLYYALFLGIKMLDLPSLLFHYPFGRMMVFSPTPPIMLLDNVYFNTTCALCDIALSVRNRDPMYVFYSALFPSDISSIANLAVTLTPSVLDCFLVMVDPAYLTVVSKPLEMFLRLLSLSEVLGESDLWLSSVLHAPYLNGYRNNHIPGLNGLWYLHACAFEQYSRLYYTLVLVLACFFVRKDRRLLPVFTNGSTFTTYLPYIGKSRYLGLYYVLGLVFEYLFMLFRTFDIINTNFLYWISFLFIMLYVFDIKHGSMKAWKNR